MESYAGKIGMIKALRAEYPGLGLREAKDFIDAAERKSNENNRKRTVDQHNRVALAKIAILMRDYAYSTQDSQTIIIRIQDAINERNRVVNGEN